MVDWTGAVAGAALAAVPKQLIPKANKGGADHVLIRDRIELVAGFAQNDRIVLGDIRSDAIIDPINSIIWFDDLGTSITLDIGYSGAEAILVAAQDVATAAGSCSILKSVDIANYWKPLWEVVGLSADPGEPITLYAKLEGGDPGTGSVSWQIMGQPW